MTSLTDGGGQGKDVETTHVVLLPPIIQSIDAIGRSQPSGEEQYQHDDEEDPAQA